MNLTQFEQLITQDGSFFKLKCLAAVSFQTQVINEFLQFRLRQIGGLNRAVRVRCASLVLGQPLQTNRSVISRLLMMLAG